MYNRDMPSVSKDQQITAAIAKNEPSKLYARNRGMLKMGKKSLSEFASTKRTGLPSKVGKK
jgi:hypothetical protein